MHAQILYAIPGLQLHVLDESGSLPDLVQLLRDVGVEFLELQNDLLRQLLLLQLRMHVQQLLTDREDEPNALLLDLPDFNQVKEILALELRKGL